MSRRPFLDLPNQSRRRLRLGVSLRVGKIGYWHHFSNRRDPGNLLNRKQHSDGEGSRLFLRHPAEILHS
jgi:hypothetical protein